MTRVDCDREVEVLDAVYTRRWPDRAGDALRAHVSSCQTCADVALVAAAFEDECDMTRAAVQVPDSGRVWWRMQMRARQDAARAVVRPISMAQSVGIASAVGLGGAVFGATAGWFQQSLRSLWTVLRSAMSVDVPSLPPALATTLASHGLLLLAIVLCLMLAPVAVYLTERGDGK
jgi:hypothetical protein